MMLLDIDAVHDMDAVTGSRRELVKAATVASQLPVLNFGKHYYWKFAGIWPANKQICTLIYQLILQINY